MNTGGRPSQRATHRISGVLLMVLASIGIALILSLLFFREQAWAALTALTTTNELDGWAWSGVPVDQTAAIEGASSLSTIGFIHLNCNSGTGFCYTDATGNEFPNVYVDNDASSATAGAIEGWAWLGTYQADSGTGSAIGWLDFDPAELNSSTYAHADCISAGQLYPAPPCQSAQLNTDNMEEIQGWARIPTLACEGARELTGAGSCDYNDPADIDNDWGWVLFGGEIDIDGDNVGDEAYTSLYRDGTLEGWAWSGGGTLLSGGFTNQVGLGWIDFSGAGAGSTGVQTGQGFVATEGGDVFIGGDIDNAPSRTLLPATTQATYLILSNGSVTNFTSEGGTDLEDSSFSGTITTPDGDSDYRSEIGRIDLDKIMTPVSGSENVYGDTIDTRTSLPAGATTLNGEVMIIDDGSGDPTTQSHTLSESLTFRNGTITVNGSGTIIVNGDLTIDANVFYGDTALNNITNLASVAWIVRGDLTITEDVSQLVGNFFVLGDGSVSSTGTVTTLDASRQQLIVYGLMMAHEYNFQRTYEGVASERDEASELIIYDGRIITNTPPGLRDMASTLPTFSQ